MWRNMIDIHLIIISSFSCSSNIFSISICICRRGLQQLPAINNRPHVVISLNAGLVEMLTNKKLYIPNMDCLDSV